MEANRILIVEDDSGISDSVALNLKYVGYECMVFDDGQKAADYLLTDRAFDLALLDIMLPGLDGFELFSYMEKYNIPVIYMTAKADSESGVRGLRDGAEDYIVKPFEMVALLVRIEKVLARTGSHPCFQNHRGVLHDGNHPARFRGGRKHRGAKDCRTMVDQYSGGVCGYCNYCDRNCRDKVHPYDADEGMRRRSCPVKNGCIEQVTATDTKAEVISCQKQAHILL